MTGRPAPTLRAIYLRELGRLVLAVVLVAVCLLALWWTGTTLGGGWG